MLTTEEIDAFKEAWYSFEEIQDIIEAEKEFAETGITYDLDEAFLIIKQKLFSKKNVECIK